MTPDTVWAYDRAADMMESRARVLDSQNFRITAMCGKIADIALAERFSGKAEGYREAAKWLRTCVANGFVPGEDDDR